MLVALENQDVPVPISILYTIYVSRPIFNSIFLFATRKNLHPNLYAFIRAILFLLPFQIPFFVAIPLQKKMDAVRICM